MGRPPADADTIRRAWELSVKHGMSSREIADELGIGKTAAADYVRQGKEAEQYIGLLDRAEAQQRMAVRFDFYTSWLVRDKELGRLRSDEAVPVLLQVERERAKLLGLYAPTKVAISDEREQPGMRPEVIAAIREARRESTADEQRLLEGG